MTISHNCPPLELVNKILLRKAQLENICLTPVAIIIDTTHAESLRKALEHLHHGTLTIPTLENSSLAGLIVTVATINQPFLIAVE